MLTYPHYHYGIHTVSVLHGVRSPLVITYSTSQRLATDRQLTTYGFTGGGERHPVFLVLEDETKAELKWLVWGQR